MCKRLTAGTEKRKAFVAMSDLTTLEGFYAKALEALGQDPTKISIGEWAKAAAKALAGFCEGGVAYFDNAEDLWGRLDAEGKAAWAAWLDGLRVAGVGVVVSSRERPSLVSEERLLSVPMDRLSDREAKKLFTAIWERQPMPNEKDDYEYLIKQLEGYPLAIVLVAQQAKELDRLDRVGWEKASAEVSANAKHRNMKIALRTSWNVIRREPQAVALWGVFHQSVVPLSVEVLKGLFGGEMPDKGIRKLRSHGLLFEVTDGGAVQYDMLNPIKQQFPEIQRMTWFSRFFGLFLPDKVVKARGRWLAYLQDLLPRADQSAVPQEKRVSYEQECAASRTVHGLLPQVWRLLADLRDAGEADAAAELMYLARNFFWQDVNSAATLEALREFFQGKAERRRDFAYANVLLGHVRRARGEHGAAEVAFDAALVICREIGYRMGAANALRGLGHVRRAQGEYVNAEKCYGEAAAICREIEYQFGEANALRGLGDVWGEQGDYIKAEACYGDAVAICRKIGYRFGEANALRGLGDVWGAWGEQDKAVEQYNAAVAICREIGDRRGEANVQVGLGKVRWTRGEYVAAEEAYSAAAAIYRETGNRLGEANALRGLGDVRRARDEHGAAEEAYNAALAICREIGVRLGEANALVGLGLVHEAQGDTAAALREYEAALQISEAIGYKAGCEVAREKVGELRG